MEKQLKDFLHYYIGCDVMTPDGRGKLVGLPFTIVGKDRANIHFGKNMILTKNSIDGVNDRKRNHGVYAIVEESYVSLNAPAGTEPEFTMPGGVIPILRKLSSMSEEERKELWQLVFNRAFNENGQTVFYAKPSLTSEPRWIMMSGVERLGIELNGHVWADSDLHHWKHNQHEVTHYLLSKGFDLWNLIDEGLAIDLNSLNTQS